MTSRTPSPSRRAFLRAASLATAVFGGSQQQLTGQETRQAVESGGLPARVIFMVADGMNHGALSLAQHYLSFFSGEDTQWTKLYRETPVVRGLVETCSANSLVTDSAAASSAWGGGVRVNNGSLNVGPDGRPSTPIQTLLRQTGVITGLVTTATITHATPAGFAANTDNRGAEEEIARQYLDRGVPVLLGGGRKFFPQELKDRYAAAGYSLFDVKDELLAASPAEAKPVLGTFSTGYMPLAIDREAQPEVKAKKPSLAEMAGFAVKRLDALAKDRWFLMVEGARVDHCGHANDAAASIQEQLDFDRTIGVMREYAAARGDTLLIVTTDHGCGGIQLNGVNASPDQKMAPGIYNGTSAAFRQVQGIRSSLEWMGGQAGGLSGPPLQEFLKAQTGLDFGGDDLKAAQGLKTGAMSQLFARRHGIAWTSANHTGDLVEFGAYGPGSHLFSPFMKNIDVHARLRQAFGIA